jgi:membrane protein DedA with SNARE-associated domain
MSSELISLETIQEIAHQYGYWTVFLGIMLENAGIPLPGETIVLVGGFLAGSGELNYWFVLGSAIAGAVLGDNVGYWVGKTGGWPLLMALGRVFRITEEQLLEVKNQFSQNAPRAVFLGRFIALLRIFAGPMAGIAQMPYPQFFLCNAAGATMWAGVMVSFAFFVGEILSLEQIILWVSKSGLVALVLIILWLVLPPWLEARKTVKDLEK